MARVFPYAAIQFAAYEQYKKVGTYCIVGYNAICSGEDLGMTAVSALSFLTEHCEMLHLFIL